MPGFIYVSDSSDSNSVGDTVTPSPSSIIALPSPPLMIFRVCSRRTNATTFNVTQFTTIASRVAEKLDDVNKKFEDAQTKAIDLGSTKDDVESTATIVMHLQRDIDDMCAMLHRID